MLLQFTPDINEADQAELRQRVETSAEDIGRMRQLRFARFVPAESAKGYQYLMSMVFENERDRDNYMGHPVHIELADPVHIELAEWCVARGCEFLYFDYDLETATSVRQPGWPVP